MLSPQWDSCCPGVVQRCAQSDEVVPRRHFAFPPRKFDTFLKRRHLGSRSLGFFHNPNAAKLGIGAERLPGWQPDARLKRSEALSLFVSSTISLSLPRHLLWSSPTVLLALNARSLIRRRAKEMHTVGHTTRPSPSRACPVRLSTPVVADRRSHPTLRRPPR